MRLPIDTSVLVFTLVSVVPVTDYETKVQVQDRDTGLPQFAVKVVALSTAAEEAEVITIKVPGQPVRLVALTEVNGWLIFGTTKTHQDRHVVLPPSLAQELASHLREHVGGRPDALVFARADGSPLRYSGFLRRVWKPAAARAGLPDATPHLLRHTAATLLLNEGASVKNVQTQLGHADGSVTLNIYSAVVEGRDDELAQRMDRIRQRGASSPQGHVEGTTASAMSGPEGRATP